MRPMKTGDFPRFDAIQRLAYEQRFQESEPAFVAHLALCRRGSWIVEVGGHPIAYLICHPWALNQPVPLNQGDVQAPTTRDCLYVHSVTVVPEHQRRGVGQRLWAKAVETATELGYARYALVSVQGSSGFWKALGFREQDALTKLAREHLASYGAGARYMVRPD